MGWRALACVCVAATSASAGPQPAQNAQLEFKMPPASLSVPELKEWVSAIQDARDGRLKTARDVFDRVLALGRHAEPIDHTLVASAAYNVAMIALQQESFDVALGGLRAYLQNAPKAAADRPLVEKLVVSALLGQTSYSIGGRVTGGAEPGALILIDGKVIGASPVTYRPSPGAHDVERITRTTYSWGRLNPAVDTEHDLMLSGAAGEKPGNVVISGLDPHQWHEGQTLFQSGARFSLPPGKYSTTLRKRVCKSIEFEVTSTSDLTYVRVELAGPLPPSDGDPCVSLRRVRTQTLKIGAP